MYVADNALALRNRVLGAIPRRPTVGLDDNVFTGANVLHKEVQYLSILGQGLQ